MLVITVFLLLTSATLDFIIANPIVHAPWGTIKGIENVTEEWTKYNAFLGIPYAMPPIGDRRFARPESHPGLNHTFSATQFGPSCLQTHKFVGADVEEGAEDCLTLNIFTPAHHTEFSNVPVMVWIHGGGFFGGNAWIYDASPIVARGDVIVVTIQYRLAAFGFLSTGDDVAKGNYGLWDQHLALQWIKQNIRSFGGDDNRITLFGESAGSASVAYQALYSGSKGLFQRTIMNSGSVTSPWAYNRDTVKHTMEFARKLNCLPPGQPDHASIIHCLRQVPAKSIAKASWPMYTDPVMEIFTIAFVPRVDGEFIKEEPLVLMNDQDYLKSIGFQDLDCMVSVNSNEGGNLMALLHVLDNLYNSTLNTSLMNVQTYKDRYIRGSLNAYFGTSTPAMINAVATEDIPATNNGTTLDPQVLFDTFADSQMVVPTTVFARTHAQLTSSMHTGKRTYMYVFDQSPSFLSRKAKGLVHGEDVYFTFGLTKVMFTALNLPMPTESERELSNTVMDFMTDFARDGNPSPAVSFKLHGDWPEFTETEEKYLLLDTQMSLASHPYSSRMALWAETLPHLLRQQHPEQANPIVHAPWGTVRGVEHITEDWTSFHAFVGIPYAMPPIGDRRFARSEPHPGFNHTFNATQFGPSCLQSFKMSGFDELDGEEDCLTLNIYTPAHHSEFSNLPVMVWIHGGGFVLGNAWVYDASPIVARGDVIVVTIQYRLAAFGFLSTGDDVAKGNYGLWDQHLALQWVKKNIRSFGGDDNRITLFGESAGSASVAFQALYSGSKGLFQKTIMQSGSVTSSWAYKRDPLKNTMELAHKLNCLPLAQADHASLIHCLRHVPAKSLAKASWPMSSDPLTNGLDLFFVPTVDGEFIKEEPLALMDDEDYLKSIRFQDLDCMVSVNSNEGGNLVLSSQIIDNLFNSTVATSILNVPYYKKHVITGILNLYFGTSTPAMVNAVASENIPASNHGSILDSQIVFDTVADANIVVPTTVFARTHAKLTNSTQTGKRTYMYLFDQSPSFMRRNAKGLVHGEDIYFTFGLTDTMISQLNFTTPTQAERELSHTLMDLLTDFARDSNPSPAVSFKLHGDWPEFTPTEEKYLLLDTHMSLASHPYSSRMALWTETLPQLLRDLKQQHQHTTNQPRPGVVG